MSKTLIIIPTFNESESLPILLEKIFTQPDIKVDVLIVDDDSPDGTSQIVKKLQKTHKNLHLITKKTDKGFSKAYITGFQYALEHNYDVICQMDADGSHQPEHLPEMFNKISEGCDYVIGSRWTKHGGVVNWPMKRKILSIGGNIYARIMLNSKVKDITGGFKAIRKETLEKLNVETISTAGYSFQIELYLRAEKTGARICETPIVFVEREHGVSKMSKAIVLEAIKYVTREGIRRVAPSRTETV